MKEEPQLHCLPPSPNFEYEQPKRFKVRFYGVTYKEELKDTGAFTWRCKKNDGTDPAFTCDDQKLSCMTDETSSSGVMTKLKKRRRKKIPVDVEAFVLMKGARRCALLSSFARGPR